MYADKQKWLDKHGTTRWVSPDEFHGHARRFASRVETCETLTEPPTGDALFDSYWGDIFVALPGESWPYSDGKPLKPLYQLNLTTMPYVPPQLSDIVLLTLFIDSEDIPICLPNGKGWVLRAYHCFEGLTPLAKPALTPSENWQVRPSRLRFEKFEDFPSEYDNINEMLPILEGCPRWEDYYDLYGDTYPTYGGTKIGGYPDPIQNSPHWDGESLPPEEIKLTPPADIEFVLQCDGEGGFDWGDTGVAWIARSVRENPDQWFLDWDCS